MEVSVNSGTAAVPSDIAAFPFKRREGGMNAPVQYICQGCLGDPLLCISICFLQNPAESSS